MNLGAPVRRRLEQVLDVARDRGALGPGPVGAHIEHALGLACLVEAPPRRFIDLGSGAGVPGLVLALVWDEVDAVLNDAMAKRCALLREAVVVLDLPRCAVIEGRAEDLARDPAHRDQFDLAVARSFGPPAVTAECAAGFIEAGGALLVAEPPGGDPARWPTEALAALGFGPARPVQQGEVSAVVIPKLVGTADRWPRRVGVPAKRPLW